MIISDKNKLFQFLNTAAYSLNDFKVIDSEQVVYKPVMIQGTKGNVIPITTLIYNNSQLQFEISNPFPSFDQYRYRYKIFGPNYLWTDYLPKNQVGYFNDVMSGFKEWLTKQVELYIREIGETDLWSEYLKVPKAVTFNSTEEFDTDAFTDNEKEQLKLALSSLKSLIIDEFGETQSQIDLVTQQFNYLIEKVESLNKFDWRSVAVSIIINIGTSLMLDGEKAKLIWHWFVNLISSIPRLPM